MSKLNKQIIIILACVIALVFLSLVIWKNVTNYQYDFIDVKAPAEKVQIMSDDNFWKEVIIGSDLLELESQDNDSLLARLILKQIENHTDNRGFYGWGQNCKKINNQYQCTIRCQPIIEGEDYNCLVSHRYDLPVIWANFMMFRKTNEISYRQNANADLEKLYNLVFDDKTYIMQTDKLNCLLIADVVNHQLTDKNHEKMLIDLCTNSFFEAHPKSKVFYSQNLLTPMNYWNNHFFTEKKIDEIVVGIDNINVINQSERINYQPERIISEISQDIRNFYLTGKVEKESNIHQDEKERFIYREIMAAIDRIGAIKINEKINPEKAKADLIDYLLLTQETLEWYINQPERINSFYVSLIGKNLKYLILNYQTDLTEEEKQFVFDWAEREMGLETNSNLINVETEYYLVYGQLIDHYLFDKRIEKNKLNNDIKKQNLSNDNSEWEIGYLTKHHDRNGWNYNFQVVLNAILAGLLVR